MPEIFDYEAAIMHVLKTGGRIVYLDELYNPGGTLQGNWVSIVHDSMETTYPVRYTNFRDAYNTYEQWLNRTVNPDQLDTVP